MSEMVERVKKGLIEEIMRSDGTMGLRLTADDRTTFAEVDLEMLSRAGIAAMREPDDAIIFVLDEAIHGDPGHNEMPIGKRLTDTLEWWQAMIDAALK